MLYKVQFMRGDIFVVEANSVSEAYNKVKEDHPETVYWDLLDIVETRTVMVTAGAPNT